MAEYYYRWMAILPRSYLVAAVIITVTAAWSCRTAVPHMEVLVVLSGR